MPIEQQIAAIKAALAALDAAIVQTETALLTAPASDKPSLRATLVGLRAKRTALQFQLDNLEAAAVVVAPLAATTGPAPAGTLAPGRTRTGIRTRTALIVATSAESRAAEKRLTKRLNLATLRFAADVEAFAKALGAIGGAPTRRPVLRARIIGNDPTRPTPKKKPPR
jgi:hypothetical protein